MIKSKFHTHCEHCGNEIVRYHNGQKVIGRYDTLCYDCEEEHKLAQSSLCFYCGAELTGIDAILGICWKCQDDEWF